MDNRSIGVFDSGLGGLTAVKQIMEEFPNESIVYFGDTGRVPYGTRSRDTIVKYVRGDIRFLESLGVKIIVVACGTASSAALPAVQEEFSTPIIGVVEATAAAAVRATRNRKIGIIGTTGTIHSGAYEKLIGQLAPDVTTYSRDCPLFVPLVENGHFDTQMTQLAVEEYLTDIRAYGVDTLILGCTHYPLLTTCIQRFMGNSVTLINSGAETAKALRSRLSQNALHGADNEQAQYRYYVSDNVDGFIRLGGIFLQREINGQVSKIDIEKYG